FTLKGKLTFRHQGTRFYCYLKKQFIRLIHLRVDAGQIAAGFSLGVFIGIFPTFGLGFILIFGLALFFKFNVPAAFIGSFAGNPVFSPLWITLSYELGRFLGILGLNYDKKLILENKAVQKALHYGFEYLIGNFIISVIMSIISYFIIKKLIVYYRNRGPRMKKRASGLKLRLKRPGKQKDQTIVH
ncbi:MAG: DUF2062 domain-containing protein, partial [bacterium]|nr:DUF2062 domain-containing protein [bacterium]